MADIRLAQGRLREAAAHCQHALQLVTEPGEPVPQGAAELYVLLSEVHLERNELEAAAQYLQRSKELGAFAVLSEAQHRWYVAKARLMAAQGNLERALDLYDQAERLYLGGPTPDIHPIAALKVRVWLKQGRVAEVLDRAHARCLSTEDDLSYLREFDHITLARILLAEYRNTRMEHTLDVVTGFLMRLLHAAEAGKRLGHAVESCCWQALAYAARGDISPGTCATCARPGPGRAGVLHLALHRRRPTYGGIAA